MTSEEFVAAVEYAIRRTAISGSIDAAKNPPGRHVSAGEKARAAWISKLSEVESEYFESTIKDAVDLAIFGLLSAIDGAIVVDFSDTRGEFELIYHGKQEDVIAPTGGYFLHEMYRNLIEPGA